MGLLFLFEGATPLIYVQNPFDKPEFDTENAWGDTLRWLPTEFEKNSETSCCDG